MARVAARTPTFRPFVVLALVVAAMTGCITLGEGNDPEVNAPVELLFTLRLDALDELEREAWPELTLVFGADDAAVLGSPTENALEWSSSGSSLARATVVTENFWRQSLLDMVEMPCLSDPITVVSDSGAEATAYEAGFCLGGVTGEGGFRIDSEALEPLIPPR